MAIDDDYIHLSVKDTGCGISEINQKKLFKLFGFIKDTQSINTSGIGIGLMIT